MSGSNSGSVPANQVLERKLSLIDTAIKTFHSAENVSDFLSIKDTLRSLPDAEKQRLDLQQQLANSIADANRLKLQATQKDQEHGRAVEELKKQVADANTKKQEMEEERDALRLQLQKLQKDYEEEYDSHDQDRKRLRRRLFE